MIDIKSLRDQDIKNLMNKLQFEQYEREKSRQETLKANLDKIPKKIILELSKEYEELMKGENMNLELSVPCTVHYWNGKLQITIDHEFEECDLREKDLNPKGRKMIENFSHRVDSLNSTLKDLAETYGIDEDDLRNRIRTMNDDRL